MDENGIIQAFGDDSGFGSGGTVTFGTPSADFDLSGLLDKATSTFSTVAKTVGEFQLARERIASANEQNAFQRWAGTQNIEMQKAQLTAAGNIEKIKAAAELQRAANAANNSGVLSTLFPSGQDYSSLLVIAAIAGVVIAFMQYRKK